jgi:hypothetical protein
MMRLMVPEQRSWPEPSPSRSPRPEGGLSKLERGGLENVVSSGDRKFESISLQRRVTNELCS